MPNYKLYYANSKGRAECARLLFAKAGVEYEDVRLQLPGDEWTALKDSVPFGSLPAMGVDGVKISQTHAINCYLARKFGLHGKTLEEEALVDTIMLSIDDVINKFASLAETKDETTILQKRKALSEDTLPTFMKYLSKIYDANGTEYLVGKEITAADIHFSNALNNFPSVLEVEFDIASYPKLHRLRDRVEADPRIAAWIEKRPKTKF